MQPKKVFSVKCQHSTIISSGKFKYLLIGNALIGFSCFMSC